jgi:hypothetical protein
MRRFALIFLLIFFAKINFAKSHDIILNDSLNPIEIVKDQVFYKDKLVARIKTEKVASNDDKFLRYQVKVFKSEGQEIAQYEVEVVKKLKKNVHPITEAKLVTLKDNVVHNASNFVNYETKILDSSVSQDEAPQLVKMVDYLIDHNYLDI